MRSVLSGRGSAGIFDSPLVKFAAGRAVLLPASYYASLSYHSAALSYASDQSLQLLVSLGILNRASKLGEILIWLAVSGAVLGLLTFAIFNLGIGRLISGAAEVASRGKIVLIGSWFAFWGLLLSLWAGPELLKTFLASSKGSDYFWPVIGTGLGAYWLFARGLGPIVSAVSWSRLSTDTHGAARTATARELRRAGLIPRKNGIYVGQFLDGDRATDQVGYPGRVHLITIGPNGSGKGTGLIVPNLATLKRSILIIDPKGEAAAITARKRAQLGRVIILNPFNILADRRTWLQSHGFNPLALLDPNSPDFPDDATGIAEALIRVEGSDPHWAESAQDLIAALVMYECMTSIGAPTIGNVRRLLTEPFAKGDDGEAVGLAKTLFEMIQSEYGPLRAKAGRFLQGTTEIRNIISNAITQTRFLDSPAIADDLAAGHGFDFGSMKDEVTTVYLILPANRLQTHSSWLRLMVVSALRALLATPPSATLPPVLFLLDEFAQLGYLPSIENAMGIARGFGVQLWPILQDLNQLKAIYKDRWQTFIGARGVLTAFAPQDLFTAKYLADLCGNKTIIVESENERVDASGMGRGRGPQGVPLFRPEELMGMPPGQMLCFVEPAKNPFFTYAPGYWDSSFKRGLDPNPYYQE